MSKYTITIKNLIDNNFNFQMTSYPIFDEAYREVLNNNILNYYYTSEIGQETPALFRQRLNARLSLIMPKYNLLYEANDILKQNGHLFANTDITETMDRDLTQATNQTSETTSNSQSSGSSTSSSDQAGNGKNLFQDTPQGVLDTTSIENQQWATNLTLDSNSSVGHSTSSSQGTDSGTTSGESESQGTSTEDYVRRVIGNDKGESYSIQYMKLLEGLQSIDQMIIGELEDLFMGIY